MTVQEYEFKLMLTNDEYDFLSRFFDAIRTGTVLQTNYYYDTRDEVMRKKNTTVRIRQRGTELIGTIKKHLDEVGQSTEKQFHVDTIPHVMMIHGVPVWLKGNVMTDRKAFKVCEGIMVMLDLNRYLDTVDYELEIEFDERLRQQAEGVLLLICSMIEKSVRLNTFSKSERFFRRLECQSERGM